MTIFLEILFSWMILFPTQIKAQPLRAIELRVEHADLSYVIRSVGLQIILGDVGEFNFENGTRTRKIVEGGVARWVTETPLIDFALTKDFKFQLNRSYTAAEMSEILNQVRALLPKELESNKFLTDLIRQEDMDFSSVWIDSLVFSASGTDPVELLLLLQQEWDRQHALNDEDPLPIEDSLDFDQVDPLEPQGCASLLAFI